MEKTILTVLVILLFPLVSLAHGNIFSTTTDSITVAIEKFQMEDPAIVRAYKGLRAWHSGSVIKVRFYYGDDNVSLLYHCEMKHYDNGEEEIVCQNQ